MSKIRLGFIGVGGIATGRHIPTFRTFDEVEITAVQDVNKERAMKVANELGIPEFFSDIQDMYPHVDAVVICTPNKFHAPISIDAMNHGKHVLCEKPMALTTDECARMIEAEKRNGVKLHIAYHYRFMKEAIAAKKIIERGTIGAPIVVRVKGLRRRKVPGWGVFTNQELQGGGALIDYGCHLLDLAMYLMGDVKPVEVSSSTYNHLSRTNTVNEWGHFNREAFEVEDHVSAFIRFDNGASMLFETSWAANIPEDENHISISGMKAGLDVFDMKVNQADEDLMTTMRIDYIKVDEPYSRLQAQNFISAVKYDAPLRVKSHEAKEVSKIIEAIYKSSKEQRSVIL
ncbi:Gfo/Idh/MocA family protein [Salinicoccus sp. HZC-1]|uniref:Gfo/Idh/MocA family protein n=1 Tax=Salinicoccus sp. HZC-1 TaxID=3385497 RepID=UPI00398B3E51